MDWLHSSELRAYQAAFSPMFTRNDEKSPVATCGCNMTMGMMQEQLQNMHIYCFLFSLQDVQGLGFWTLLLSSRLKLSPRELQPL